MVGDEHVCYRCKFTFCTCDKRLYPDICYTCKTDGKGKHFWNRVTFYDLFEIYNFYRRFPAKGMKPLDKLCLDCFKKLRYRGDIGVWTPWNNDINEESIDGYDPCRFMASEYSSQYSSQYGLNMGFSVNIDHDEENEPLRLLKIRLAKGEITLEEFNKLKDVVKP